MVRSTGKRWYDRHILINHIQQQLDSAGNLGDAIQLGTISRKIVVQHFTWIFAGLVKCLEKIQGHGWIVNGFIRVRRKFVPIVIRPRHVVSSCHFVRIQLAGFHHIPYSLFHFGVSKAAHVIQQWVRIDIFGNIAATGNVTHDDRRYTRDENPVKEQFACRSLDRLEQSSQWPLFEYESFVALLFVLLYFNHHLIGKVVVFFDQQIDLVPAFAGTRSQATGWR